MLGRLNEDISYEHFVFETSWTISQGANMVNLNNRKWGYCRLNMVAVWNQTDRIDQVYFMIYYRDTIQNCTILYFAIQDFSIHAEYYFEDTSFIALSDSRSVLGPCTSIPDLIDSTHPLIHPFVHPSSRYSNLTATATVTALTWTHWMTSATRTRNHADLALNQTRETVGHSCPGSCT